MKTWGNGSKGGVVKKIIDDNFAELEKTINQIDNKYIKNFEEQDWSNGSIYISMSEYNKPNPVVELYIKIGNTYSAVIGGYNLTNDGIEIVSDIGYEGRVIVR